MKKGILLMAGILVSSMLFAQYDWDDIDVPAEANNSGYGWELVEECSDDFNYESPSATNMGTEFSTKWNDGFINNWSGPGNTIWTPNASIVTGGNLQITASRKESNIVYFQAVTAKTKLIYPVYVETRMKVMNSVMANAVWMLSDNSAEEIDIVEAYGSSFSESANTSKDWFARRMHLSHHTFDRSVTPALDYQPQEGTWYNDGTYWRDDFRIVGVYWRDPFHLEYYIDGELVRTVSGADVIDPNEYLDGNGLSKEETIIISGASQGWQVDLGVWPTDDELAVVANNIFKVDWIRTYKRIDVTPDDNEDSENPTTAIPQLNINDKLIYSNPMDSYITIKSGSNIENISFYNITGHLVKSYSSNSSSETTIAVNDLPSGLYIMQVMDNRGRRASNKVVKQ